MTTSMKINVSFIVHLFLGKYGFGIDSFGAHLMNYLLVDNIYQSKIVSKMNHFSFALILHVVSKKKKKLVLN